MRTLGAPGGRWLGSWRRWCLDSCKVGPATLAEGTGGKGRMEPSAGAAGLSAGLCRANGAEDKAEGQGENRETEFGHGFLLR